MKTISNEEFLKSIGIDPHQVDYQLAKFFGANNPELEKIIRKELYNERIKNTIHNK